MGLLDGIFGTPEQTQALGLLGAGLMAGNPAQAFGNANQFLAEAPDRALKRQLTGTQIQDMQQQIELRKQQAAQLQRRNDMITGWLGQLDGAVPSANQAVIGQTGNLAPTVSNGALQTQALQQSTAGNPLSGIPRNAIQADLAFNDGKNIAEWMFKRGTPNMQVSNGYAYDQNAIKPGFLPQFNVSQDGKAALTLIGPNGLPVVSAPSGALDTYTQFRRADETEKARLDPMTITPLGAKNPVMRSRLDVMSDAAPAPMPAPAFNPAPAAAPVASPRTAPTATNASSQIVPADVQNVRDAEALPYMQKDVQLAEQALAEAKRKLAPKAQIDGLQQAVDAARRQYAARSAAVSQSGVQLQSPSTAKFNDAVATNEAGQVNDAYTRAAAAKQALPALWQAQELLKAGTFTGMGSDGKLNVLRALSSIGIPVPESVANSQDFDATLSQIVGKNIKAVVGSNGISNSDVKFVQGMFGQRGQEAKAIQYILDKAVQSSFRDINAYNGMLPTIQANGGQSTLGEVKPPESPKSAPPQAAVNMLRMNPKLRDQFDAKYGMGASSRVLGQ